MAAFLNNAVAASFVHALLVAKIENSASANRGEFQKGSPRRFDLVLVVRRPSSAMANEQLDDYELFRRLGRAINLIRRHA